MWLLRWRQRSDREDIGAQLEAREHLAFASAAVEQVVQSEGNKLPVIQPAGTEFLQEEHWSEDSEGSSDFDSASSNFSGFSEIPEAILEESETDLPSGCPASSDSADCCESPRNASVGPFVPLPRSVMGRGTRSPKEPVRRARVRGTVCLTTSAGHSPECLEQQPARSPPPEISGRCRWAMALEDPQRPSRPWRWEAFPSEAMADERFRLERERELAARRAHASEEALAAERASHEAELAKQAEEAAERQALLIALDHDRAELALMYREARLQSERLQVELSQKTAELMELRQGQDGLTNQVNAMTRPSRNSCVVCLEAPAIIAVVPCGHLALCEACQARMQMHICPVCRHSSASFVHIFTP